MDVLFDLDGTLVDPKPGLIRSVQHALGRLGFAVPPADWLLWLIGPPFRVSIPKLLGMPQLGGRHRALPPVRLQRRHVVDDGVPAAVDAMRAAGCPLFVATSKPHRRARPILERFDLAHRFAGIYGPELDGTNEHKHDLIAHIIAREGVAQERALMIGDREFDVAAASRNGIPRVGVTWGCGTAVELPHAGACALCPSPARRTATVLGLH